MKVMVSHIPNTFNYGSAMMAINLIYYLNKKINDNVGFFVDTRTDEDLQNLIKSTGLKNIEANNKLPDKKDFIATGKNVNMDLNWIGAYCDEITNYYNCFIVLGGDDLSEYYSKEQVTYELFKINRIAAKIPVLLIGQTVGPFTAWRKGYAVDMLKTSRIFTRDYLTSEYLKNELGI
ncbi:MAG TPA: polysaccharide pyruvyl transferase family protein, partial [Firmicutes bacterium]|nr:polysaccharide pyruvyl transferase family protein [Bacillota bacterium]